MDKTGLIDEARSPIHATGVGLVLNWPNQEREYDSNYSTGEMSLYQKIKEKMGKWLGLH